MKIIIVDEEVGRRTLNTSVRSIAFGLAFGVASLLVVGGLSGWKVSEAFSEESGDYTVLFSEAERQRAELLSVREQAQLEIDSLTQRLGELQGRMLRLDALGERLTRVAKLDVDEFNFSKPPAMGGPESHDMTRPYAEPLIHEQIDELLNQLDERQFKLQALENLLRNHQIEDDVAIAGRPIEKGWLSSRFGRRSDPFTGRPAWHKGLDFAGRENSNVIAVGAGVVTWSGTRSGYGELIEINHGGGLVTRYGHNKTLLVEVGDQVSKGQAIALMGSSGRSTGPHVHFEVLKAGKQVDPEKYIYRARR